MTFVVVNGGWTWVFWEHVWLSTMSIRQTRLIWLGSLIKDLFLPLNRQYNRFTFNGWVIHDDLVVALMVFGLVTFAEIKLHSPSSIMRSAIHQAMGHFTHKPRALIMKLWELKRKCPKATPNHLQNHVVWPRIFECSVKSWVTRYLNQMLFQWMFIHACPRAW